MWDGQHVEIAWEPLRSEEGWAARRAVCWGGRVSGGGKVKCPRGWRGAGYPQEAHGQL